MVKLVAKENLMETRKVRAARQNAGKRLGHSKLTTHSSMKIPAAERKSRDAVRLAAGQIRGLTLREIEKESNVKIVPPKPARRKQTLQQLYWSTKTEMLSIIEEDLKLKLEIRALKEQFIDLLSNFEEFKTKEPFPALSDDQTVHHEKLHEAVKSNDKDDITDKRIGYQTYDTTGFRSTDITNSTKSSYGNLDAPNHTTASGSQSNLGEIFINELSKEDFPIQTTRSTRKSRRLRTVREAACDTSSDSSYNQPYPNHRPALHPSLKHKPHYHSIDSSLADMSDITRASDQSSRWYSSTNELHDDGQERAEQPQQSTPTNNGQHAENDIKPLTASDACRHHPAVMDLQTYTRHDYDYATPVYKGQSTSALSSLDDSTPIVIPKARRHLFAGVIDYRDDSGITGSNSDHTSSPSTLREYTINPSPRIKQSFQSKLAKLASLSENARVTRRRTFDCAATLQTYAQDSLGCSFLPARQDFNITGENTDDSCVPAPPRFSPESYSVSLVARPASRSHEVRATDFTHSVYSPTASFMDNSVSSYKESDGALTFSRTADVSNNLLGERPEMVGKEASVWYPPNRSPMRSVVDGRLTPDIIQGENDLSSSVKREESTQKSSQGLRIRPPCIGKEATPVNLNMTKCSPNENPCVSLQSNKARPEMSEEDTASYGKPASIADKSSSTESNTSDKDISRSAQSRTAHENRSAETIHEHYEAFKKTILESRTPTFRVFDYTENIDHPKEVESKEDNQSPQIGVIDIDEFIQDKGEKKKTFFKLLKGFGKHFRVNSRRKSCEKTDAKQKKYMVPESDA